MADRAKRCEGCRFWEPEAGTDGGDGECHRNPPENNHAYLVTYALLVLRDNSAARSFEIEDEAIDRATADNFGVWPRVMPGDWCGEWKPKE